MRAGFRPETKDGKRGLSHPKIGFIPWGRPTADDVMVCAPATGGPYVEGEKLYRCGRCGRDILVSPSGQQTLARTPGMKLLCLHCLVKDLQAEAAAEAREPLRPEGKGKER